MPGVNSRERHRSDSIKIDRQIIAKRVNEFYSQDLADMDKEINRRLERYAKFRMWTTGKDWPWPNASDSAFPDMMTQSLRLQDTIHNAVMAIRPTISSKSKTPADVDKQEVVDNLIDYQVFEEQNGEYIIGELIDAFVNDGHFTAFIPWIRERRQINEVMVFDAIPEDLLAGEYFEQLVTANWPDMEPVDAGRWDWESPNGDREVKFYTNEFGGVEAVIKEQVTVYDGPRIIPKSFEEVLYPGRAGNLQPPGPSNPRGASHVILVDRPTVDEIKRLYQNGFYDLATEEEIDRLGYAGETLIGNEIEDQADSFQGHGEFFNPEDVGHRKVTRLICFDMYDMDGDGLAEDVIFWVIKEHDLVLKAKPLTEMYPANPPRRPFAEAAFVPVRGRRGGVGMLEMIEGLHDLMKAILDQSIDAGTLSNSPFGFYRPSGSMKPEVINLWPGELYPIGDPARDIAFPNMPTKDQTFGLNMITMLGQLEERLTVVGDFQLGRVPAGRSSALRTSSNMQLLAAQGDARPERIMRRFFNGLVEVWRQIHELNQRFLPAEKVVRIAGVGGPDKSPYIGVNGPQAIMGRFDFTFSANIFNTNKQALQQSLSTLASMYINALSIQLGIVDADGIYRIFRDIGKAFGQDPEKYLHPPTPDSMKPKILAEEAIDSIMSGGLPDGAPLEPGGYQEHYQKLAAFASSDQFGLLTGNQPEVLREYMRKILERVKLEQQQAQLAAAAQQFSQQSQQGAPTGRPPEQASTGGQQAPTQPNELVDETLPGAGGGGNA